MYNKDIRCKNVCKIVRKLVEKMQTINMIRQHTSISKQVGFVASCWLAIDSLSYDRTPENYQGSREGSGYA